MKFERELTYQDSNGHLVVITEHVLAVLEKYKQTEMQDNEAAGVLLGEKRGQHIVITDLSEPGFGDLRQRNLVDRRGKHHQQKVDDCFQLSGERLIISESGILTPRTSLNHRNKISHHGQHTSKGEHLR